MKTSFHFLLQSILNGDHHKSTKAKNQRETAAAVLGIKRKRTHRARDANFICANHAIVISNSI